MTDLIRSADRTPRRHRRWLVLLVAAAALGMLATLLVDRSDPAHAANDRAGHQIVGDRANGSGQPWLDPTGWARDLRQAVQPALRRACNPRPPEYPGCSVAQINNWENGDVAATKAHYPQNRWGQAGFNWSNLGPAHNDKLRRLYNDAVNAYTAKQNARGVSGKAAQPKFATWGDFKAATDCSGGFWGAAWSTMCRFSSAMDKVVPDLTKSTLVCGGWALIGGAVGRAVALVMSTVAPEAAGVAIVGSTAYCTLLRLAGAMGIPTPKAKLGASGPSAAAHRAAWAAARVARLAPPRA